MRRYDVFLPITYNDGSLVEKEKFSQVENELLAMFGAFTVNSITAPYKGVWKYGGVEYRDDIVIFLVITEHDVSAEEFFLSYKEVLKERFQQLEILITYQEIHRV